MENKIIYIFLALIAGAAVTFQGPINGALGKVIKPEYATLWSFISGTIIISLIIVLKKMNFPNIEMLKGLPWWMFIGGIIGIFYVFLIILIIPKLGSATTIFLVIVSQILTAILIDNFGLVGLPVKLVTINRFIGLVFMLIGVYFVNK